MRSVGDTAWGEAAETGPARLTRSERLGHLEAQLFDEAGQLRRHLAARRSADLLAEIDSLRRSLGYRRVDVARLGAPPTSAATPRVARPAKASLWPPGNT
jgi:hypothetical protein